MARVLLALDGVFSERLNQNVVEVYLHSKEPGWHRNNNPSVNQFMENTQAPIVL